MLYLSQSKEITTALIGAALQEIIEQAGNNLRSRHSRRGVNLENRTRSLDQHGLQMFAQESIA